VNDSLKRWYNKANAHLVVSDKDKEDSAFVQNVIPYFRAELLLVRLALIC